MDITFDTIISILSNKKNNFINKINIVKTIDQFNFDIPVFRIGVFNQFKNKNISLLQSLLYLINPEYIYQTTENKYDMMAKLINDMRNYWKLNFKETNEFTLLKGEKLISNFPLYSEEEFKDIIYVISFCLKTNFLILDFNMDKTSIISYYSNKSNLNFYKPFIILAKHDINIEPVFNNLKKIFRYDNVINFLTEFNSIEIENIFENKSGVFISKTDLNMTYEKLKKKKKIELQQLCDDAGIKYIKKDIKSVLIDKLIN
tara:strand:+ start:3527 stop:4303 length:777 start_codon:yes stop_codon:yes gene_type:complete